MVETAVIDLHKLNVNFFTVPLGNVFTLIKSRTLKQVMGFVVVDFNQAS